MQNTRIMAALVILDTVRQDLLPTLGDTAPDIIWDPTVALMARLEAGERADALFAIDDHMERLLAEGKLRAESYLPIVQAAFGIAVQSGLSVTRPQTAEQFIDLLRAVPSIAISRVGASGIFFEKLIDRLGIGEEIRAKTLVIPAGLTGEKLTTGEAVLAFQQFSELKAVPGIDVVGLLPDDCQQVTNFSAAVFTDAKDPEGAQRFINLLRSPEAARSFAARGLKLRF
jgi:molybdate transport system substrate-binding protein